VLIAGIAEDLQPQRYKARKMAPEVGPYNVFVPKPLSMPYAEAMGRLRQWLDHRKLQTTGFKVTIDGRIGFEISFSSERDAAELQLFDWER
jgi:hypothetical protein